MGGESPSALAGTSPKWDNETYTIFIKIFMSHLGEAGGLVYNLSRLSSMRKDTKNWIALTDYDIDTARHMLATGRYLYVIFLCHLSLEKILKAHVAEVTQTLPIKTHDLIYLVKKSELEIPETYLDFIGKINTASIPTRYPDDLQRSLKEYPEPVARDYLEQTEEILQWLKQHPNLNE